jgi:RNase adaptor protein for sRNA GlmZ degradation
VFEFHWQGLELDLRCLPNPHHVASLKGTVEQSKQLPERFQPQQTLSDSKIRVLRGRDVLPKK